MYTHEEKSEIQRLLKDYVGHYASQAKAVVSLTGVSEATVIGLLKDKWESISDAMWTNIAKQVGYTVAGAWHMVMTNHVKTLYTMLKDAKEYSNVVGIVSPAGSGKTSPTELFAKQNENVYHLQCSEYFNKKTFLAKLLQKMGKDNTGYSVAEMVDEIVEIANKTTTPVIILDEADKLRDEVLFFFITLYNLLQGKCAIVLMATPEFEKRIRRGERLSKRGYSEIFSRLGRKFIELPITSMEEVIQICHLNGVGDKATVMKIFNESEGDLRRVKRCVHREKRKAQLHAA